MKKFVAAAITIVLVLSVTCALADETENIFAVVIDFDYENDAVDCLDEDGNIWSFYGIEDWIVGDTVLLTIWMPNEEIVEIEYLDWMNIFELSAYVMDVCE